MITINGIQELFDFNLEASTQTYEQVHSLRINCFSYKLTRLEKLDDLQFQKICNLIPCFSNLGSLVLRNINFENLNIRSRLKALSDSICKCHNLKFLDLSGVEIKSAHSLQAINDILMHCPNLIGLSLAWIRFGRLNLANTQAVWNNIAKISSLTDLCLTGVGIDELETELFQALCNAICECKNLQVLTCLQIEIDNLIPAHFQMLCDTIAASESLKSFEFTFIQNGMCQERYQKIKTILVEKKNVSLGLAEEEDYQTSFESGEEEEEEDMPTRTISENKITHYKKKSLTKKIKIKKTIQKKIKK